MNVKKGVKNIVYSLLAQAVTLVLGIIIPRLVIVSYGSEMNGLLSSVKQVIGYLALLEAGVGAAALQALYRPISEENKEGTNAIVSATHYYYRRTGIAYLFLMVALSFVYPIVISSKLNYWLMVSITFITGLPNVITYFFQGKLNIFLNAVGDSYIITNLSLITNTLASVTKILLLLAGANIIFVQTIYCVVSIVHLAFVYIYVKVKYPWVSVKCKPDVAALSQKNSTLIHQICGLVTKSTDTLVLSIFCGLEVASIYAV
ncbi:MAG: sugar isomerase, partial [Clostridia bacterium]|nr:sugar isomerase [Clostridia bacterium]